MSQNAPFPLYRALLMNHGQKIVHYIGNRVPFGTETHAAEWRMEDGGSQQDMQLSPA